MDAGLDWLAIVCWDREAHQLFLENDVVWCEQNDKIWLRLKCVVGRLEMDLDEEKRLAK